MALSGVHHVETPYDDFKHQPLLPNKLSQLGAALAWGDADGDGEADVLLGNGAGLASTLLACGNDGVVERVKDPVFDLPFAGETMGLVWFDADGDDDLDIFQASGSYEFGEGDERSRNRLLLNSPAGFSVAKDALPAVDLFSSAVAVADVDKDGDLDVFVGCRMKHRSYPLADRNQLLINQGDARFEDGINGHDKGLAMSGLVTGALWSDVNDDGWPDLLLSHEWGPVRCFINHEGRLIEETDARGFGRYSGWWNGIIAGDFNADGRMDYAVSNMGLNTKYKASEGKPIKGFYGDYAGDGQLHFVETKYEGDQLLPVRGKSCSTHAMPHLAEKFASFHAFASASLQEIYAPDSLASAEHVEINTLESGVFMQEVDGQFRFEPLPRSAQIAPGFGLLAAELTGDAQVDLVLAQNFISRNGRPGEWMAG